MEFLPLIVLLTATTGIGDVWCQETIEILTSSGNSGVQCARNGRKCLYGMRCVRSAGRCECPQGETGNAEIDCAKPNEHLCLITGDPVTRVVAFGGADQEINVPCTFRATRFITRTQGQRSYCSVEVHVTSEAHLDTHRVRAVHLSVGLTEPLLQLQTNAETVLAGGYGLNGTRGYRYTVRTSPVDVFSYGSGIGLVEEKRKQPIIVHSLDAVNNMAVLTVPACGTKIKFRAYDAALTTHPLLSGVAIVVPQSAEFYDGYGNYPYSLCGRPQDTSYLYKIQPVGGDVATSILASVLGQRSPQFENAVAEKCQTAVSLYNKSPNRASDVDACAFLLTKKVLRHCLQTNTILPIDVFNACLLQRQRSDDVNACTTLYLSTSVCAGNWTGSTQYCPVTSQMTIA